MLVRRILYFGLIAALGLVILSLTLGGLLGQPILLGYVETGSMEPSISPGDGFVSIPAEITGPIKEGDVVIFRAPADQDQGLTTHRVVGQTNQGYITKGDANPFTDQDADEPPVKHAQIVAKALQVGGNVVVIPHLGTILGGIQGTLAGLQRQLATLLGTRALLGTQGLAYLILGITGFAYAVDYLLTGPGSDRSTDRSCDRDTGRSTRLIVAGLGLLVVLGATAAMVGPAGSQEIGIVSAEFESENPTVIEIGESEYLHYTVSNSGLIPVYSYLEPGSEGVKIAPRELTVPAQSTVNATLTLSAPPETGYYHRYVVEHRYLAILPKGIIRALHSTHPWLPIIATGLVIWVPFYLLGIWLVGTGRVRRRTREGPGPIHRFTARFR